ncbi:zinc finger BED domain-containing protein RICESLEEPER 2-like [Rhizophagus irregularis DAOM 181602=DAOM 197198]|nr:zinc finger BED domain-containing protein RICESLEEPER 2-like [Rhizophagus irregularis DAOM 181602=DAOM 197198]
MTSEFEENDIEETAEEEAEEEAEYETEEEAAEEEVEEEAESETEENQVDDTETEEWQIEKNIEREVEQEETNTKKRSWVWKHFTYDETVKKAKCKHYAFIPSADTIKNYIMTSFNDSQKKVASILQKIGKLKSFLLDFIKLEGPHSGANIKDAFLKSLKNFNIESKILGVTTDNASNNITFLKAVESDLSQRYIYYDSDDKHVRCLAHVINLAAQQVLTTLKATDNDESSNEEVGSLIVKLQDFRDTPNRFENGKVSELYMTLYAPQETQNTNIKYNSSDEDLVSHIFKRRRIESRHEEEYPNLSNMAKDYLGVPATSAPAERIFSSAADVITYDRASLAPKTVRAVMCLKHWFRSGVLD